MLKKWRTGGKGKGGEGRREVEGKIRGKMEEVERRES